MLVTATERHVTVHQLTPECCYRSLRTRCSCTLLWANHTQPHPIRFDLRTGKCAMHIAAPASLMHNGAEFMQARFRGRYANVFEMRAHAACMINWVGLAACEQIWTEGDTADVVLSTSTYSSVNSLWHSPAPPCYSVYFLKSAKSKRFELNPPSVC